MKSDDYVFFWGGIFSNWYPSDFKIDNFQYCCGEQYMMHQKALIFKDEFIASKILSTNDPKKAKQLGRSVKNFDSRIWDTHKYDLVKHGLRQKFIQNPILLQDLLNKRGKIFVEASPFDRIWGIGYSEKDAMKNISTWGENLLGKILTELSEELN